jgi:hypothetical protein
MQVALLSKVSSFSSLISMICVNLSFQIGSNLVGVSLLKSLRFLASIIIVKKSAFNNWSYNPLFYSVTIRV